MNRPVALKILITGGAGFIGSTIASACADAGHVPVIVDDLSTGLRTFGERFPFYSGDIADRVLIRRVLAEHPDIDVVIHCAARIVVPESMSDPLGYYENNVAKSITLVQELLAGGVTRLILSSTASMYAASANLMVDEDAAVAPLSPYAASKWLLERVLHDATVASDLQAISLRYFNPIGADPRLRTGLQNAKPSHALGQLITRHAAGETFALTGTDWPTRDGSGLRDYIHVWDLASAHVAAVEHLMESTDDWDVINLGTGRGTTVRELIVAFEEAVGSPVAVIEAPARPGDVAGAATSTSKAERVLGWKPEKSLVEGVRDALAWADKLPAELSRQ